MERLGLKKNIYIMVYSNNTYEIIEDIDNYYRTDFKQVYCLKYGKWYMLNNLNEYEEYGIYGDSLDTTTYIGKLVIYDGHEYEWNGTEWNDIGTGTYVPVGWINFDSNCRFSTDINMNDLYNVNKYLKVQSTGMLNKKGNLYSVLDKSNGWFQLEYYSSGNIYSYWNIGSKTLLGNVSTFSKWQIDKEDYVFVEIDGINLKAGNKENGVITTSSMSSSSTIGTPTKTLNILWHEGYSSTWTQGTLYNIKIWNEKNGSPIYDFYCRYDEDNNEPYLYDFVNDVEYRNLYSTPSAPTFTQDGGIGTKSKEYEDKGTPTLYIKYMSVLEHNNQHINKLYTNVLKKQIGMYDKTIYGQKEMPKNAYIKIEPIVGQSYTFNLNNSNTYTKNNYTATTPNNQNYMYVSNNYGINNSHAWVKITFFGISQFSLDYYSWGESSHDYIGICALDTIPSSFTSPTYLYDTKGEPNSWKNVVFNNEGNEHFIYIDYRKDDSASSAFDAGIFTFPQEYKEFIEE